jgi:hypothetical protein
MKNLIKILSALVLLGLIAFGIYYSTETNRTPTREERIN